MGNKIIFLNEVESTNNYANGLVLSDAADEGTVVMARFQQKGKGQQGNGWESEAGKNLLASIVLYPKFLSAGKQFYISKFTCLAIAEVLVHEVENVSVKWPNDIYIENKKVAGILIENSIKGATLFSSVVGIGLNLNQEKFVSGAPNPVALKQITGKEYDVKSVLKKIVHSFFAWYEKLKAGDYDEIDSAYMAQLYRNNEWRLYRKNGVDFEARIVGIGEFGQLRLELTNGEISTFMFKEVEFVI